jgi:hypothetical protein
MNSRLPEEFRDRTKQYAAGAIRLFVKLPQGREEIEIADEAARNRIL